MPDSDARYSALYSPADLLETLLDGSLTGIALLRPLYAAEDETKLIDLAYVRLNAAAQQAMQLPEYPADSVLVLHPDANASGLFNFYQTTFQTGEAGRYTLNYQRNEANSYLHLAAKRSGQVLVVNISEATHAGRAKEVGPPACVEDEGLTSIFNALPEAYLLLSPDLLIEAASDSYLAATLTQRGELLGQHLFAAFPDNPETPEAKGVQNLRDSLEQVRTMSQPHEMALQHYDVPDPKNPGQFVERYWLPRNTPVLDAQGRLRHYIHSVINVTESIRVEAELRESRAREVVSQAAIDRERQVLQAVIQQAPVGICLLEGESQMVTAANKQIGALWGYTPEQVVGKPLLEAVPALRGQGFTELIAEVAHTLVPYVGREVPAQLGQPGRQETRYFDFVFQPLYDGEDAMLGVLGILTDTTTQVRARQGVERNEAQLQRLNQQLEAANQALLTAAQTAEDAQAEAETQRQRLYDILEQLPASISTYYGPNHVYQFVNPRYQHLFPARTLQGRAIREALPELEGQQYFELLDQVYQTGELFYGYEVETWVALTETGKLEQRYFNVFLQALRDGQGDVNGLLNFAYDVTEQVQARRQAEHSQQQVERLNQELAAANEELFVANEEVRANINELQLTEQALLELNNDLETRVAERTQQVRQAQQEVERQRARLERFFMQAPAAICILDGPDLVYELVNPGYQQLFPGRELQGRSILEALPEIADNAVYQTLRQVYDTGVTHEEQALLIPIRRPEDGVLEDRYFNYVQQARYNEHGQIDGILVFAFEVTTEVQVRQRAEALQAEVLAGVQRIAQEREAFYQVFEQTPASIALLRGPEHQVQYHNPAYQQLFPGRNMRGLTIAEIQPDALAQGFVALLDNVYQTGETFYGNEVLLIIDQPGGRPAKDSYFNFNYQAYRENGLIVGVSVFAYDVTEQVWARQQREAQQAQLRAMFEQAPVAIGVFQGSEYLVEVANPALCRIVGRASAQLVGRPLFKAVPEANDQGFQAVLDKVRQMGRGEVAQEVPVQIQTRPNGSEEIKYFNFAYEPLRDGQGNIISVAVVASDVTEQVLTRQQVEQSQVQVQELNEELATINEELQGTNVELGTANQQLIRTNVDLDNFIYTASHDLRAPIANIEGLLHALTQQLPEASATDTQVLTILQMMQGAVERFQKTIDHLTDVTKLQKEHVQPSQAVNLAAVVEEVCLDLAPLLKSTQARLDVDVAHCPTISFSQKNLRSVVYNLLSNALKYRHPDRVPHVRLRCQQTDSHAELSVQDNGLGLTAPQQARLFGMFQRLHDHVEGTGIGLYMVKRMVENGGGHIQVESQLGVGSTFTISFPR
ncbi:PAS domain-containing protein [uncultured Hymenobacter sp.]|uniref:PAS domain-containing sensor histidine kinase n=1 Tax=uncultured Hymenobacter sp. TaxID=170016 RepID=UPI0035CC6ED7